MGTFKGSNHILICGWSPKGFEIIRELRAKEVEDETRDRHPRRPRDRSRRRRRRDLVRGTPSNGADLLRAGLDRVSTVIVLADSSNASNEPDDLSARSLLTTLAVESINPRRTRVSR